MMGYSYDSSDTPVMCFNPAKSWQLGWYSDRHTTITSSSGPSAIKLASLDDYGETTSAHTAVVKIEAGTTDYLLGFNKAEGMNSGTLEAANQVTVTTQSGGGSSSRVGAISNGGTYRIRSYARVGKGKAKSLIVEVCEFVPGSPDYAQISVHLETDSSTCSSGPAPSPVSIPVSSPFSSPTGNCGGKNSPCSGNGDCCNTCNTKARKCR